MKTILSPAEPHQIGWFYSYTLDEIEYQIGPFPSEQIARTAAADDDDAEPGSVFYKGAN